MATIEYKFVSINRRPGATDVVVNFYAGDVGVEPDQIADPDTGEMVANPLAGQPTFVRSSRVVQRARTLGRNVTVAQIESAIRTLAASYPQHTLVPWQA